MGVNDLRRRFYEWCYGADAIRHGARLCRDELNETAMAAWHPVSEPPSEEDANAFGEVAYAYCKCGEWLVWTGRWHGADNQLPPDMWAHTSDVVLLPQWTA